jgi:hypothetical protein
MSEFPGCSLHLPDALKCPGVRRGQLDVSSGEISERAAGVPGPGTP